MRQTYLLYDMPEPDPPPFVRVVVVGKPNTGKTSLIRRMVDKHFSLLYTPTTTIEISPPVTVGDTVYVFYEIPYSYDFGHPWRIDADVVLIMYTDALGMDPEWWEQFVERCARGMEAFWVTTDHTPEKHRHFKIDSLAFTGFSDLMYHVQRL
jgi:hypothetical protein